MALLWLIALLATARAAVAVAGGCGPQPTLTASGIHGPALRSGVIRQAAPAPERGRVPPLWPPVVGRLVRGFDERAAPFGPGHRGVDFAAPAGSAVTAPAAGRVVFAGKVAGTAWLSVEAARGVVVTVGPLQALSVSRGRPVSVGARVGPLAAGHGAGPGEHDPAPGGHAIPPGGRALAHLGLRVDGVYVDPLPWITGLARPRLAPLLLPGGPRAPSRR